MWSTLKDVSSNPSSLSSKISRMNIPSQHSETFKIIPSGSGGLESEGIGSGGYIEGRRMMRTKGQNNSDENLPCTDTLIYSERSKLIFAIEIQLHFFAIFI